MKNLSLKIAVAALVVCIGTNHAISKNITSSSQGFMENKGQIVDQNYHANPDVKFLLCRPGLNVQLRQTGFSYDTYGDSVIGQLPLPGGQSGVKSPYPQINKSADHPIVQRRYHRVDVELLNCNTNAQIIANDTSHAYFNYFTGGAQQEGAGNVHYYQRVTYINIYPHIDLEFETSSARAVEYRFIVHPGGHVSDIQLAYRGANKTGLQEGKIKVEVASGRFTEHIPGSYIVSNSNTQHPVDVKYQSMGNNIYSFVVNGQANTGKSDLIIDPTPNLGWGTYFGGTGSTVSGDGDQGNAITTDRNGNVCVTGSAISNNIATNGEYQTNYNGGGFFIIFIAKFNGAGTLLWCTYYSGTNATTLCYSNGIATDTAGNIYIAGSAYNSAGMATAGSYRTAPVGTNYNAIIAKFDPSGKSLLWATYYTGSVIVGANAIALDGRNNVFILGWTESTDLITTPGAFQPAMPIVNTANYVAEFNSSGSQLLWATYFGGLNYTYANGNDSPIGIAVDKNDNVYITGVTSDDAGLTTAGAYRMIYPAGAYTAVFVAKLNPALTGASQLVWGTYYGGYGFSRGGIALDSDNNVYITGSLIGSDSTLPLPTTIGTYQPVSQGYVNAYIAKFNPALLDSNQLVWGTYYGAGLTTQPTGIALDACRNITITGWTTSDTLIATPGAWQDSMGTNNGTIGANEDAFVAKFDSSGKRLLWGTYYGGGGQDNANAVALNGENVYITGLTSSTDSIATPGAWLTTYPNTFTDTGSVWEWSGFVAEFNNAGCLTCFLNSVSISTPKDSICSGDQVTLTASATPPGTFYLWNTGATTQSITADSTGNYSCIVYSCQDTVHAAPVYITVFPAPPAPDIKQQHDTLYFIPDTSYTSYQWYDSTTFIPGAIDTFLVITHSGNYNVKVQNVFGCVIAVGINATINPNGINEYSDNYYISLSPNPTATKLTITGSWMTAAGSRQLNIYNMLGEKVICLQTETGNQIPEIILDVSKLSGGIYLLQLNTSKGRFVKKFIKE